MMKEFALSIAITWILIKIIKTFVESINEKKFSLAKVFHDGGMPSMHTIAVVTLATSLFLETGFSTVFVIGVIIAFIVMNDAFKVRLITQEQSKILNKLTEGKPGFKKLNEHVGHTLLEVLVGLVIGILGPLIIYRII